MLETKNSPQKKEAAENSAFSGALFTSHFNITLWIGGITIGVMGLFGGSGFLLDKLLGTKPTLMVAGLLLAFPISQYAVNKKVRSLAFKIQQDVNQKLTK